MFFFPFLFFSFLFVDERSGEVVLSFDCVLEVSSRVDAAITFPCVWRGGWMDSF